MTRIKICGITSREDAHAAIALGADALGFIFVPSSPRYVGPGDEAARILDGLPPFVDAVFVCRSMEDYQRHPCAPLFTTVQVYEPFQKDFVRPGLRVIAAIRVRDEASLDAAWREPLRAHAVLLDAYHPNLLGGSGASFDWNYARRAKEQIGLPIILAGGLNPENVGEAVRVARPYAVDVSSGVEAFPGRKDVKRMERFVEAVRRADLQLDE